MVVDPAAGLGAQIERLAAKFGLTIAETRVLGEIIGGNGLLAAAAKLKITEATARSHANRILAKTGTTRQTELIRRFFGRSSSAGFLRPRCPACPAPKISAKIKAFFSPASKVPLMTRPEA